MNSEGPGFFDYEVRLSQLGDKDPLSKLDSLIEWEDFRPVLEKAVVQESKAPGGRPRFDVILMFKVLVLQRLYNLSDESTEYQIRDRLSFMRFIGVNMDGRIPDEKTIWRFREELKEANVFKNLWKSFHRQLTRLGIETSSGKIIDASIVQSSRGGKGKRDNKEETDSSSKQNSEEETDKSPSERQIDADARWTAKRNKYYFGYKNHIKIDEKTKLIESSMVTSAEVHDSQALEQLLDEEDAGKPIYADKGYAGMGCLTAVIKAKGKPCLMHKAYRNKPITEEQRMENRQWSKIRSRVEHVFGFQKTGMRFDCLRCVGKARAEFTIQMNNLVYNLRRLNVLVQPT